VKLTSTNRPFGLIIKLSQTVFERVQTSTNRATCLCLPQLVRPCRTCNASQILLSHSRAMSQSIQLDKNVMDPQKRASFKFPVITPRGSHPFPSRTRKLSLAGPMILHGQLCGNVGRRRIKIEKAVSSNRCGLFLFPGHRASRCYSLAHMSLWHSIP
jgi:hypothetical protein